MSVGDRIKNKRKELNMSAEQLAEKIGVSPATIYRYENGGIRHMGTDKLAIIADALLVEPKVLMGWLDDSNVSENNTESEPTLSAEAQALARIYDGLDAHSQRIVMSVAKMESERTISSALPKGITDMSDMPFHRIPNIGTLNCTGELETRYAARQELAELESSPDITPAD